MLSFGKVMLTHRNRLKEAISIFFLPFIFSAPRYDPVKTNENIIRKLVVSEQGT